MKKKVFTRNGHNYYLLGEKDGQRYFLESGRANTCGWYYAGGYVEVFTNNRNPERAKDISFHSHFDTMFFNKNVNGYDVFNAFFDDTPLEEWEKWKLVECMKAFYTAREYSDMLYRGGSHYTQNPVADVIKDGAAEYERINNKVIPALLDAVYKILTPEEV